MSAHDSVGIVRTKFLTFAEPPNEMLLDSGSRLGPITLAYETYGTLNTNLSNAILITHALSGDAHVAGYHSPEDRKPGWWDSMVGPGKAFDTNKYFVVCSNVLGGCSGSTGPSSINPATGLPYGLEFPIITIGDMVRAQVHLVDHLGVKRLLCVAGGSMGGMQALAWATSYPHRLNSVMLIASSHMSSAQAIAFNAVGRQAILGDHAFDDGAYYSKTNPAKGLAVARMLAHITYLSQESMHVRFGRNLRGSDHYHYDFDSEFAVETYLDHQGEQFVNRFDANSYLYITKAIDYFDLSEEYGSLDAAMDRVLCNVLVLSYSSDWLYPPAESEAIVYALTRQKKNVTYCNIESSYGHDAFLLEVEAMEKIIGGFLDNVRGPGKACAERSKCACAKSPQNRPIQAPDSIYEGRRIDYERIIDFIESGSSVLDVGCGDGILLCRLITDKRVEGLGIEVDQENIISCAACGIPVIHADIDKGLGNLPDSSFDFVILGMTLQEVQRPDLVLREMLRIGNKCIVTFPNFAFWKNRVKTMFRGKSPVSRNLPYAWYDTPNRHFLSIADFREFCETQRAHIVREIPLSSHGNGPRRTTLWPNFLADEAIFIINSSRGGPRPGRKLNRCQ